MKSLIFILLVSSSFLSKAQFSCNDFSAIGTTSSPYFVPTNANCQIRCNTTASGPWTDNDCTGYIDISFYSPQTSYTFYLSSFNTDDYVTISIDGGGVLSITDVINANVNGSVVGPFLCDTTYGDISFKINSSLPFQNVYIANSGCSSGAILFCPETAPQTAGNDTTIIICNDSIVNVYNYLEGESDGGVWSELSNSNEFNDLNGQLNLYNLDSGLYEFTYEVENCGNPEASFINISYGLDSSCFPIDSTLEDSITVNPTENEMVNAFSPNGDGVNDFLWIKDIDASLSNTVSIYNRWGDQVAYFENYNNNDIRWTGNYAGINVGAGTYYYLLEYDNGEHRKGWVQLLR